MQRFMKRYYYEVGEFSPESESKLAKEQYINDGIFIDTIFHVYKLHPMYSEKEREDNGMNYIGFLDHELYNWRGEGGKLKWIDHTIQLFNNMCSDWNKRGKEYQEKDLLEFKEALKWLLDKREECIVNVESIDDSTNKNKFEKIKWLGSPSQFGYIFSELVAKGFIELPIAKGKSSYAALAKACFEVFEIKGKLSSLLKELSPTSNSLEHHNKKEFKIPQIEDLY